MARLVETSSRPSSRPNSRPSSRGIVPPDIKQNKSRSSTPRAVTPLQTEGSFLEVASPDKPDAAADDPFLKEDLFLDEETLAAMKELNFAYGIPAMRLGLVNLRQAEELKGPGASTAGGGEDDELDEDLDEDLDDDNWRRGGDAVADEVEDDEDIEDETWKENEPIKNMKEKMGDLGL